MAPASFLALAAAATLSTASAAHWAVIAAGSSGFGNYRHQADACHAYQIVKNSGIPEENIIMMIADDVAHSSYNPFPGKLYNHPTKAGDTPVDVYAGCYIDYRGQAVTSQLFLDVLTGNASGAPAGGKVLKSTSEDNVFVYFTDHGGVGLVAFPYGPYLYADQLNTALTTMHTNKMYNKMVFYLEACESGSMFDGILSEDLNIFATTAAGTDESSWAQYCSPNDIVGGVSVGSCLGDEYSVNWMEDSEAGSNVKTETLAQQYAVVNQKTVQSTSHQYGTTSFQDDLLQEYQGNGAQANHIGRNLTAVEDPVKVNVHDVPLFQLYSRAATAARNSDYELQADLLDQAATMLAEREAEESAMRTMIGLLVGEEKVEEVLSAPPSSPIAFECYRAANEARETACGSYTETGLRLSRAVANLCAAGFSPSDVGAAAFKACA